MVIRIPDQFPGQGKLSLSVKGLLSKHESEFEPQNPRTKGWEVVQHLQHLRSKQDD